MDTTAEKRPQLPALSFLDADKAKWKEDTYHNRNAGIAPNSSNYPTASPTGSFSPGPPPPYSQFYPSAQAQYPSSWQGSQSGIKTPPGSRRTSREEKEDSKPPTRQLLPSISEALGVDSQKPYAIPQPPASSSSASLHTTVPPQPQNTVPSPPSPKSGRSFAPEPPHHSLKPFPSATYSPYRSEPSHESAHAASQPVRPLHTSAQESHPPHSQPPAQSSQHANEYPHPQEPLLKREPPHVASTTLSAPPAPPSFSHGYTPYVPRYGNPSQQPQPSSSSAGPLYQPSTVFGAPTEPSSPWKADSAPRMDDRPTGQGNFGESVKRHLEFYDLELALNDISYSNSALTDFVRRYSEQMHSSQRSGTSLASLPSIVEIDDMVSKSRAQHDALVKIREVVLAQRAAFEQQAADQRQQLKHFGDHSLTQANDAQQRAGDDSKSSGFAGADPKKRRGRAAPPGRCHSCNRAETPEWRRGPDGARTLCNACGLHYAKLTRKSNYAKQNASLGSSNLRPKENAS